jgi:TolA-binding protein
MANKSMDHFRFDTGRFIPVWLLAATLPALPVRADEATAQYSVASGFYNMNRFEFAAEEYEKFLNAYPKHDHAPEALYFLGESYYHLNKVEEARARYRELVAKHTSAKNFTNALYRLGETSLLVGDATAAHGALAEFVRKRPDDPLLEFALPYLGRAQLQMGKQNEAKSTLRKAMDRFPKGQLANQCQFDLAQTLDQLGEKDEAIRLYRSLASSTTGKYADNAQLAIGTRHFDDKNYEVAMQAFHDLENRFPKSPSVNAAKLNRALCLYQLKRFEQAQPLLEAQTRGNSSDVPEVWYWLGMTQKARGQWQVAANTLLDSYTRFPDSPLSVEMLFYAAHCLFQQGQYAAAIERFQEAITNSPKHDLADDSLYYAAESARAGGQHERTFMLATQFFREYPQSSLIGPTMLAVAQSLIALGRNDEASKYLADLLLRQPAPELAVPAQYYRGLALRAAGKLDEAVKVLEALLDSREVQDPAFQQVQLDAQFLCGSCYFEEKDYAKAIPPLAKYLATLPTGDVAGYAASYLVVCFAELRRFDELRSALSSVRTNAAHNVAVPALFRVAETCLDAKEFGLAAHLYAEVAQKEPQGPLHVRALSGLGWSQFHGENFSSAAQAFGQIIETAGSDALASEAAYMRGRALEADGKLAEATAAYQTTLAKYGQGPQAPEAALQLARVLQKQGKGAQAIAAYEHVSARWPQAKQLDVVLYEWAWALQQHGQDAEAQKVFDRLASQFPESSLMSEAVINVGEALYQAKRFDEVLTRLMPLLKRQLPPEVREAALYRLGRTHVELAAWADVRTTFDQLMQEFPASRLRREAEFWAAEAERQQGQPKVAIERLTKLITEPVPAEPWLATAYLRLAQAQGEQKQWKEMLVTIEQLRRKFPGYELLNVADYHTGRALQNLARFDEAREAYRRGMAGRSDENAAQCQFMIGETLFHQRRFAEALREFLKVEILYAFPHWQAAALLEAGKCHESLEEWTRATETYNRILEKYSKTPHVPEARERRSAVLQRVSGGTGKK